jgi:hypothetical protein
MTLCVRALNVGGRERKSQKTIGSGNRGMAFSFLGRHQDKNDRKHTNAAVSIKFFTRYCEDG